MKNDRTFAIYTLGCKLNYSESSHISRKLTEQGFSISYDPTYIILNSCAVTGAAEKKGRNLVSKLHRQHPAAKIIVVGCYSELDVEQVSHWEGVYKTYGTENKINLVNHLLGESEPETPEFFSAFSAHSRTRSFLKIQDGCDYHCTYCTVAKARGSSRSDTIANAIQNIKEIHELGIKEVNLTGVNVGDFGHLTGESLFDLLQQVDQLQLIERVRISSIEPNLLTPEIVNLVSHSNILMPHFHIPLQSGCDRILALMKRRYNTSMFANKVMLIKELMPHSCIAVDVITGFPGETDEDFNDTCHFIESLPISYLHVFTYSKRPDTDAADMKDQVQETKKRERTNALLALSDQKKELFYHQHYGTKRPVLVEEGVHQNILFGFTDNYIKVKLPFSKELPNSILELELTPDNCVTDLKE
jgi:threonylcarbamoyladenosine tRNA methylthiotransferase MtaB